LRGGLKLSAFTKVNFSDAAYIKRLLGLVESHPVTLKLFRSYSTDFDQIKDAPFLNGDSVPNKFIRAHCFVSSLMTDLCIFDASSDHGMSTPPAQLMEIVFERPQRLEIRSWIEPLTLLQELLEDLEDNVPLDPEDEDSFFSALRTLISRAEVYFPQLDGTKPHQLVETLRKSLQDSEDPREATKTVGLGNEERKALLAPHFASFERLTPKAPTTNAELKLCIDWLQMENLLSDFIDLSNSLRQLEELTPFQQELSTAIEACRERMNLLSELQPSNYILETLKR
jgi:hypothetical protein